MYWDEFAHHPDRGVTLSYEDCEMSDSLSVPTAVPNPKITTR
jgi:hypothetical protein